MSAIFGIIRFDGAQADSKAVARMGATLSHRAPDGMRVEGLGPVCLGHGRMRVQREDIFDAQPLSDDRGEVTLVFEGRLDNREELAETFGIAGDALRDMPDSTLILGAYRHWGADCAEHLLGDFAFAIWDAPARRLVLARDHMGQRHLMFHRGEDFLAFASEIKALWALPDVPRAMSDDAVIRRLLVIRDEKGPDTLFEGIEGLKGGERMVVGLDAAMERRRYWTPHAAPEHEGKDEAYYVAAYRRVLAEAVSCRLRRLEGRSALHLSGGFDSSAIAGLAGDVLQGQGRTILGIASVMPESRRGEFLQDARPMVEYCDRDMPHLDVHFMTREGLEPFGGLDEAMPKLDGPPSTVHYIYKEAARVARSHGIRQLMDGHGGDYTLNPRDPAALPRLIAQGDLRGYFREMRALRRRYGKPMLPMMKQQLRHLLQPAIRSVRLWTKRKTTINDGHYLLHAEAVDRAVGRGAVAPGEFGIDQGIVMDARLRIARAALHVSSQVTWPALSMAAVSEGLVVTRPFHDKRVLELGLAIPQDLYFKNGLNRYLARRALADVYPPEFRERPFHNDRRIANFEDALASAGPRLSARARGIRDDVVRSDAIAKALEADQPWDEQKGLALNLLMVADYRRWFEGNNQ